MDDDRRLRAIVREEMSEWAEQYERRQSILEDKIRQWELGACLFRWFVIVTAGIVTALAGAWDWARENLR